MGASEQSERGQPGERGESGAKGGMIGGSAAEPRGGGYEQPEVDHQLRHLWRAPGEP